MLGAMGKVVDGWMKFVVAIVAVGWFGLKVADQIVGGSDSVANVRTSAVLNQSPLDSTLAGAVPGLMDRTDRTAVPSMISELFREVAHAAGVLAGSTIAQMAAVLVVGLIGGLAMRPRISRWSETLAYQSARRRADRHAQDLRIMAAHDARGNAPSRPSAAVQPMKRN